MRPVSEGKDPVPLLACLALAAFVTLPFLGARDLWAPDEPRYAQVAQEMLRDGHWWYPHVNSRPYPDKPPLYFWLAAAAGIPKGRVSEAAARIPSALSHLLLVALTFHLGRRFFGTTGAVVASCALATTWLQAWMSRRACLDVLLTLCATAAIAAMLKAGDAGREGRRGRLAAWAAGAGIAVGLGFMTKGPVVLIAVAAAGLPLLFVRAARAGRPRGAVAIGLGVAVLATAVVLAAWLIPAREIGGYHPLAITQEQFVDRAAEGRHHRQPIWYFLESVPPDFLPWTLLAIPAVAWAWRRRERADEAVLLGWTFLPILAHSISVEKRNIYVLPIAPAVALLVGGWIASMESASTGLRRAAIAAAGLLGVAGVAALLAPLFLHGEAARALSRPGTLPLAPMFGALAILAAALIALELKTRAAAVRVALAVAVAFAVVEAPAFAVLSRFDSMKSSRVMGEMIRHETGTSPLAMHPRTWDAYVYYSGRSITDLSENGGIVAWLATATRPAFVLAYEGDLAELPPDGTAPPKSVGSDDVGHRRVHLLRYDVSPVKP